MKLGDKRAFRRAHWMAACLAIAGCTVTPVPLERGEREQVGEQARTMLFANQEAPTGPITLAEATARSVKYYADYRLRNMEEVLSEASLDVARFDLLPRITASAGYTTRNNDSFGFGFSPGGTVAANPSASSERTRSTLNLGFAWNILDFGVSYFKAKQLADQSLIARERRHKAVQILAHDVRQAWWRAEAAQRLLPQIDKLLSEIESALERTRLIEQRKLLPPTQVVSLRRALLELEQQISFRRQELAQSRMEFAALVNLPPGAPYTLKTVPLDDRKVLELTADADRLDTIALAQRPELAEEAYKARVSESEAKKALLGLLPNLSLDFGLSSDSNRFLVNNTWTSAGLNVAFNLVKAFSLPAVKRSAEAQRQVDEARRMAVAMSVLTQTRIAAVRYTLVAHEYGVWREASDDDQQIVKLLESSAAVGIDSELELIRAKARAMVSSINRDLSYANLESTVAQLYQSLGQDLITDPKEEKQSVPELTTLVEARFAAQDKAIFSERTGGPEITMALGPVSGVEPDSGALLNEGMNRVFSSSRVRMVDPQEASYRVVMRAELQPPRSGSQPARIDIRIMDGSTGQERHSSEFRTTLSAPVDAEQLRVLGEGAAYRILVWLPANRSARVGNQLPGALRLGDAPAPARPRLAFSLDGGSLGLQLDSELRAGPMSLSQALGTVGETPTP